MLFEKKQKIDPKKTFPHFLKEIEGIYHPFLTRKEETADINIASLSKVMKIILLLKNN